MKNDDFTEKMDKSRISISSLYEKSDEKEFWQSKTPLERIKALESIRQIIYGYDPSTTRLQRILSINQLT